MREVQAYSFEEKKLMTLPFIDSYSRYRCRSFSSLHMSARANSSGSKQEEAIKENFKITLMQPTTILQTCQNRMQARMGGREELHGDFRSRNDKDIDIPDKLGIRTPAKVPQQSLGACG